MNAPGHAEAVFRLASMTVCPPAITPPLGDLVAAPRNTADTMPSTSRAGTRDRERGHDLAAHA